MYVNTSQEEKSSDRSIKNDMQKGPKNRNSCNILPMRFAKQSCIKIVFGYKLEMHRIKANISWPFFCFLSMS